MSGTQTKPQQTQSGAGFKKSHFFGHFFMIASRDWFPECTCLCTVHKM